MMLSGLIRRSVPLRAAAAPAVDWAKLLNKYDGEEKAEIIGLRNQLATIETKLQEYSAPPAPIDWAGYKEAFGGHPEVSKLEQDFMSFAYPTHKPKSPEEIRKEMDPQFVQAAETADAAKQAVEDLTKRVQYLRDNMTHEYTTLEEHYAKYPGLEEWVDDEIARMKWIQNTYQY